LKLSKIEVNTEIGLNFVRASLRKLTHPKLIEIMKRMKGTRGSIMKEAEKAPSKHAPRHNQTESKRVETKTQQPTSHKKSRQM